MYMSWGKLRTSGMGRERQVPDGDM